MTLDPDVLERGPQTGNLAGAAPLRAVTLPARSYASEDGEPADDDRINNALSWLRLMVVQRDHEVIEQTAQNLAYIDWLLDYPIDLVLSVIRTWPRKNKFWPAWSELQEEIERAKNDLESTVVEVVPKRPIVRDCCIVDFASTACKRYIDLLKREPTLDERQTLYGQAIGVGYGKVDAMGITGEPTWLARDIRQHMPHYREFDARGFQR